MLFLLTGLSSIAVQQTDQTCSKLVVGGRKMAEGAATRSHESYFHAVRIPDAATY
jgi:hypothetical protein